MERRKFFSTLLLGIPVTVATPTPAIKQHVDEPTVTGYPTCSCGYHMMAMVHYEGRHANDHVFYCVNQLCPHFKVLYRAPHIPMERV
jgi:hypothetical protein